MSSSTRNQTQPAVSVNGLAPLAFHRLKPQGIVMPIFRVDDGRLVPFTRLAPGPDLYEQQIEDLIWSDLEAFTGEALFPVCRQPVISVASRPDILALRSDGTPVIIEVKRDIDRGQLAQVLEYAGWARLTNLDEISRLYRIDAAHAGPDAFFSDWTEFTEPVTPVTIASPPALFLIARDFRGATRSAIGFLEETGVPITVTPVTVYSDPDGNRVVYIDAEHDLAATAEAGPAKQRVKQHITVNGERVSVRDLLEAEILLPGEQVVFTRPRKGQRFDATIEQDGTFTLSDGRTFNSPSLAAMRAADVVSYDGWKAWRVPRLKNRLLDEFRSQYVAVRSGHS